MSQNEFHRNELARYLCEIARAGLVGSDHEMGLESRIKNAIHEALYEMGLTNSVYYNMSQDQPRDGGYRNGSPTFAQTITEEEQSDRDNTAAAVDAASGQPGAGAGRLYNMFLEQLLDGRINVDTFSPALPSGVLDGTLPIAPIAPLSTPDHGLDDTPAPSEPEPPRRRRFRSVRPVASSTESNDAE